MRKLATRNASPARAMVVTALAIFAAEAAIMLVFTQLPPLPEVASALIDAGGLLVVTLPVVYFAWFRPLRCEIERHTKATLEVQASALEDHLTGLPNRVAFLACIRREMESASRTQLPLTVVVLDVRHFGELNGALGHESGDLLLQRLGERLRNNSTTLGVAARLGSDLFGMLLPGIDVAQGANSVDRLHDLVEVPFFLGDAGIQVEVRTGFSVFPNHAQTPQQLLQRAELALQRAKRLGERGGCYREESEGQARRRLGLVGQLRAAIERGDLTLVYQPKVDLSAGQFAGVEALVRWTHPELGPISPAEFVPLAEQTNLIRPLTFWVIEEAVRQAAAWKSAGLDVSVSVNLSARNLSDPTLPDHVRAALKRWNVESASLVVEVTESAVLSDPERSGDVLERLRELGVGLSIDDFGTGYGSLTYVSTMPATELKIDRSFVHDLETNENHLSIVRAVIGLAHTLGLLVVCEGVENEATLARLRQLGCDVAQGYGVSKPLAARDVADFVASMTTHVFSTQRSSPVSQRRLSLIPKLSPHPALRDSLRAIRITSNAP